MKKHGLILFFLFSISLFSQNENIEPYVIKNKKVEEHITDKFSYLLTHDKTITPSKIIKIQNQLQKNYCGCEKKDVENLPIDIWLIGKIKNDTKDTLNLVFFTSNSQEVTTYLVSKNKTVKKTIGYIQKSKEQFSKEMVNSFNFNLLPNEEKTIVLHQEVYLKFELIYKFNILSFDAYNQEIIKTNEFYQGNRFFLGLLSGSLLLLFIYNFILFIRIKSKTYLFYSLYILCTFIFILLVIDRNRNSIIARIMLHYEMIKETSYLLCILFYGFFVKSVLKNLNAKLDKAMKVYLSLVVLYLFYLVITFYSNPYTFDESTLIVIKLFKYFSFVFFLFMYFKLYKEIDTKFIKFIFIGSSVLVISYLIQATLEYLDQYYINRVFSKLFIRTNASILLGTLIEISFFSYALFIKSSEIVKEKIILENLSEIKSRFFANISHEFRTPLTLIKSPVQSLQNELTDQNQINKLNLIDKNSNRMLDLVDQLLELSKLDNGKLQLILKEGNISSFLTSLADSFTFQAKENKLSLKTNIQKITENHHFDKDVIEKIVTNLLSNAIKYTNENETINFDSKIENNQLQIVVSNSGSEIKKEELPKLFERFYQKKENHQGVGIGLALVKELVDLYQGKIASNVDDGILSFTVSIPLEKSNANAILVTKDIPNAIISDVNKNEKELPILLLIDDNPEIRTVLKDIFKNDYQIIEAENGEQALKIAKKEIPDCIISDVMMPIMDGFEFTKQIKSNELTSFIPVVLLTAKTSDEAHLEGLKSTADAFLTKPFNNNIVKETVIQLINERKKLHQRYSQELVLRPVDIVINSVDEKFIEKLQVILDKELSNAEFSSEDFASAVGMSRMQLHRKLKSLLGVTSTEFLRNERLKIAAELLKKGNGNISDVAYAVGFNDVSYFSKCFKEMYGSTPSYYFDNK